MCNPAGRPNSHPLAYHLTQYSPTFTPICSIIPPPLDLSLTNKGFAAAAADKIKNKYDSSSGSSKEDEPPASSYYTRSMTTDSISPVSSAGDSSIERIVAATKTAIKSEGTAKTNSKRRNKNSDDSAADIGRSSVSRDRDAAYYERRRKNNIAAKRSRDAKRKRDSDMKDQLTILHMENKRLRQELSDCRCRHVHHGPVVENASFFRNVMLLEWAQQHQPQQRNDVT